jgi:hypothetical protein
MSDERIILVDKVRVNVKMKEAFLARAEQLPGSFMEGSVYAKFPWITTDDRPPSLVQTTAHSPKQNSP